MRHYKVPYFCLSGFLLVLSSPPFGLWPLIFIAFFPLFDGLETEYDSGHLSYGRAFLKGHFTGLCYSVALFFWVVHLSIWALLPIAVLFACFHGLLALGILLSLKAGLKGTVLSFWTACLWVSIEVLGSGLFLSLPSYAVGYLVWEFPIFIQIADISGVFGVSFWIIMVNVLLVRWWREGLRNNLVWAMAAFGVTLVVSGYGYSRHSSEPTASGKNAPITINLVHSAVKAEEKRDPALEKELFERYRQMTWDSFKSRSESPDLFVWPETSVPVFLRSVREKEIVEGLLQVAQNTKASIVLGARSLTKNSAGELKRFNAAFLVPPKGYIAQEYHKILLAPFVEMTPLTSLLPKELQQKWRLKRIDAGEALGLMTLYRGKKLGVFICWEAFYPNFVRKLALEGAGFLVNITNDEAAFGGIKPAHLIPLPHAVYRAVENRRFLVRCANWGPSMFISPQGDIINSSLVGTEGVLSDAIMPIYKQTFLTCYGFILAKCLFFFTLTWGVVLIGRQGIYKS